MGDHSTPVGLTEELRGRTVVADTSSLLMVGTGLLNVLQDCTLVIPAVVVRELEDKRSHPTIGLLSRQWIRLLEELRVTQGGKLAEGVPAPAPWEDITIRVEPNHRDQKSLPEHLQDGSHDSTILAVANNLRQDGDKNVILLSNDTPMRLHSTLDLNIDAIEFNATRVLDATPFDGRYTVTLTSSECANSNYWGEKDGSKGLERVEDLILSRLPEDRAENAYITITLDDADSKPIAHLILTGDTLTPVARKVKSESITGRTIEQDVAMTWLKMPASQVPIVSLGGSAGTGKTLVAVATGINELRYHYDKIIVFRSLHELGQGQEIGFLPGDVNDKMAAWSGAVFDAIDVIASKGRSKTQGKPDDDKIKKYKEMVEIAPITFLRGRSLARTFMILEEAQNFSRNEILNILSRAGEGSKVVLTFDAAQVDNRFLQSGKHADIWSVVDSLKDSDLFAHITLKQTERSEVAELAASILENQ